MTLSELVEQAQKMIEQDSSGAIGRAQVFVETPAGQLILDEISGGHDTFEGIFVFLRGADVKSTLSKYIHRCDTCRQSYAPVRACWCRKSYAGKEV